MSIYCPVLGNETVYLSCQDCDRECEKFHCLIVGSRHYNKFDEFALKVDKILANKSNVVIVSGGASGADALAKRYALEKGYSYREFPADWKKYGKKAGYIRNRQMHEYVSRFDARGVIAFWNGNIKSGTAHSFDLSKEFNNPIRVVKIGE